MIYSSIFGSEKTFIEDSYSLLKVQSITTNEYWKDRVQERYYGEYINPIQNEVLTFINSLSQLDRVLVNTLNDIERLLSRSSTDERF